jgi:hypothetical protein
MAGAAFYVGVRSAWFRSTMQRYLVEQVQPWEPVFLPERTTRLYIQPTETAAAGDVETTSVPAEFAWTTPDVSPEFAHGSTPTSRTWSETATGQAFAHGSAPVERTWSALAGSLSLDSGVAPADRTWQTVQGTTELALGSSPTQRALTETSATPVHDTLALVSVKTWSTTSVTAAGPLRIRKQWWRRPRFKNLG